MYYYNSYGGPCGSLNCIRLTRYTRISLMVYAICKYRVLCPQYNSTARWNAYCIRLWNMKENTTNQIVHENTLYNHNSMAININVNKLWEHLDIVFFFSFCYTFIYRSKKTRRLHFLHHVKIIINLYHRTIHHSQSSNQTS